MSHFQLDAIIRRDLRVRRLISASNCDSHRGLSHRQLSIESSVIKIFARPSIMLHFWRFVTLCGINDDCNLDFQRLSKIDGTVCGLRFIDLVCALKLENRVSLKRQLLIFLHHDFTLKTFSYHMLSSVFANNLPLSNETLRKRCSPAIYPLTRSLYDD